MSDTLDFLVSVDFVLVSLDNFVIIVEFQQPKLSKYRSFNIFIY